MKLCSFWFLIASTLLSATSPFSPLVLERREVIFSLLALLDERPIASTPSGVEYSDARIGGGETISTSGLFHVRALLRDGSILFDTRDDSPILHEIDSSGFITRPIGKITPGLDEAMKGMKEGGVRMVVVQSESAYGYDGVSRFTALRMGLKVPVPRDEILRYEVEALRCLPAESNNEGLAFQACCTEPNYPCKTEQGAIGDKEAS